MTRGTDLLRGARARTPRARVLVPTMTVGVVLGTFAAIAPAYAFLTQTGSTSGNANVGDSTSFVISTEVTTPAGALLYPGGPQGAFTIAVEDGERDFRVTAINRDPARDVLVTEAGGSGCLGSVVTLDPVTGLTIDVTTADVTRTFPSVVSISSSAANGCQGATFAIPVTLTGVLL